MLRYVILLKICTISLKPVKRVGTLNLSSGKRKNGLERAFLAPIRLRGMPEIADQEKAKAHGYMSELALS